VDLKFPGKSAEKEEDLTYKAKPVINVKPLVVSIATVLRLTNVHCYPAFVQSS